MMKRLTSFITVLSSNPWARIPLLTIYYLAIVGGLILLYGKGNFSTPKFVYQEF